VTATSDRDLEIVLDREGQRIDHIGAADAARDHRRPPIDQAVVHAARRFKAFIAGQKDVTRKTILKRRNDRPVEWRYAVHGQLRQRVSMLPDKLNSK
jgi:hypothetical protein